MTVGEATAKLRETAELANAKGYMPTDHARVLDAQRALVALAPVLIAVASAAESERRIDRPVDTALARLAEAVERRFPVARP